ncbi:MAG TPA: glycosyl hydrolase family 28-related protein, partial [Puia sp.]
YPSVGCFSPLVYNALGKDAALQHARLSYIKPLDEVSGIFSMTDTISAALFFRRSYYEQSGGFDPHLFDFARATEDQELFLRMRQKNLTLYFVPSLPVFHDESIPGGCDMRTVDYWVNRERCMKGWAFRYRTHGHPPGGLSLKSRIKMARSGFLNREVLTSGVKNILRQAALLRKSVKASGDYLKNRIDKYVRVEEMTHLFFFLLFLLPQLVLAQGREEFNGSYSSWADVKKRFGAKGNGISDDTRALQTAIDSLSCPPTGFNTGKRGYMVVYLPAGTYCISSTLVLRGRIGVSIIGQDPANTTIKWIGGDKDTLFWADGSAYFKVARLTWDANKKKDIEGIGLHWKNMWNNGKTQSFATLNIEFSDNVFIGGFKYGISGGTGEGGGTGNNDSEVAIRRCTFRECSEAGIEIMGYNALDYWVWDCAFLSCTRGIHCSFGGYHVYRSYFSASKTADLHNMHGYYNSARGCYSEGSRLFSGDDAISENPFKRTFQDNVIIRPYRMPVQYYHLGKITLFNNKFTRSVDSTAKASVHTESWAPGTYEVLSIRNTYPYTNPIEIASNPNRLYSVGDKNGTAVPGAAEFQKTMEKTPPLVSRKVFDVPAGADADAIQALIDQAAKLKGQRPILHFGMGTYIISKTLVIPAGADMQLVGDGLIYASSILQKNLAGRAFIRIKGPSFIEIRDLQIGTDGDGGSASAIVFEGLDQAGAQAHLDQIYSHADTSLSVEAMNYLYVQKENSFFNDGNYILGGPLLQKGGGTARVCCFGSQFARLSVQGGGRFVAKDCWWEGANKLPLDLRGSGTICIDDAMVAPNQADSGTAIRIGKFNGHISLMNMYVQGALLPEANNPGLNLLVWNINFYHKMNAVDYFLKSGPSYKGAFLGCNAQCFNTADPNCKRVATVPDRLQNVTDVNTFLDQETAPTRETSPQSYKNLNPGVSNIRISRVSILGNRSRGIAFVGS